MKRKLPLATFRLKNFKAVQDSKTIKLTPLTDFQENRRPWHSCQDLFADVDFSIGILCDICEI